MALEHEQSEQQDSMNADADTGGDDLSGVLGAGGGDGPFVSGEGKKPLGTGTLIMAGFLLACGAGTYVMYTRSAPASTAPSAEAAAAQTTITQFLSDDKENVSKMKDLLHNTEKAVEQFRAAPGKLQVPVDQLRINPFRIAADEEKPATDADEPIDTLTSKRREEAERAATLKAAQGLTLQFIVSGRKKSCMINNAKYGEGDTVGEFTVDSITATSVVVSKGSARFELKMKK
jgi:hypothetical protein